MITHWWCLHCAEAGVYNHTAKGEMTAKGTPARHTNDTGHTTFSSLHPRPEVPSDQPA